MSKNIFFLFFFQFLIQSALGQTNLIKHNNVYGILNNDHYRYVSVNQILMWISNNGDGSHDPLTDGNGFYWPGGINATKSAVFEDGLVFGGVYDSEVRVNGNTHRQGLQAGKILPSGIPDDPSLEKYRVYLILRRWENLPPGPLRDQYELDYNEWPILDGAPYIDVNLNGEPDPGIDLPEYVGDETAWYVANDMDPNRSTWTYGTMPMGLEFQTTVFAYKLIPDIIFKKYVIINKGSETIHDMYLNYWNDVDLGDAGDDFAGCDTLLNLAYVYNADNYDGIYGTAPPAIGYDLLQGPVVPGLPGDSAKFLGTFRKGFKNLPMTSFIFYIGPSDIYRDPVQGSQAGAIAFYNYMQGLLWSGLPYIDPLTNQPVKFALSGDPVAGTGWYQGPGWPGGPAPNDMRELLSAGPFNFSPGDTQEVIIGIAIAKGSDNINSITALKDLDKIMQNFFDNDYVTSTEPLPAELNYNLFQNYPNPFNPSTLIRFDLPKSNFVKLKVYDILGNEIAILINNFIEQGTHSFRFNPLEYGVFSTGIYFYKLETGEFTETKKMIYLK